MKLRGTLLTFVLGIGVAACADPRRTAVPPPGGEPSGFNGTSGVSTMRYQEESLEAQRIAQQKAGEEAQRQARLHQASGATTTATARR